MGSGVEGWGTSPAEPRRVGDGLQRPLRSRFPPRLTPGVSGYSFDRGSHIKSHILIWRLAL
jgi:hypothetical protein